MDSKYSLSDDGKAVLDDKNQVVKRHGTAGQANTHLKILQANERKQAKSAPAAMKQGARHSTSDQEHLNKAIDEICAGGGMCKHDRANSKFNALAGGKSLVDVALDVISRHAAMKDLMTITRDAWDVQNASSVLSALMALIASEGDQGEADDVDELVDLTRALLVFISGEIDEMDQGSDDEPVPYAYSVPTEGETDNTSTTPVLTSSTASNATANATAVFNGLAVSGTQGTPDIKAVSLTGATASEGSAPSEPSSGEKAIAKREDVSAADKERAKSEYGDVKFADEKNKKYPINDEEHIRSAWNYINKEENASKYDPAEVKQIKARIVAAWKDKIDKEGPPAAREGKSLTEATAGEAVAPTFGFKPSEVAALVDKAFAGKSGDVANLAKHMADKYGTDHLFTDCMNDDATAEYDDDTRKAVCARVHYEATGKWPTQKALALPAAKPDPLALNFSYVKSLHLSQAEQWYKDVVAVKSLGHDRIRGYLALWGDPDKVDIEHDFFTSSKSALGATDFWDSRLALPKPLTWDHAQDPVTKSAPIIGTIDGLGDDDVGRWYEAQLDIAYKYRKAVDKLISQRQLGTSSDSAPQYVMRVPQKSGSYWLKQWPLFAAALTPAPCEPRMLDAGALYWKSLGVTVGASDMAPRMGQALDSASVKSEAELTRLHESLKAFVK